MFCFVLFLFSGGFCVCLFCLLVVFFCCCFFFFVCVFCLGFFFFRERVQVFVSLFARFLVCLLVLSFFLLSFLVPFFLFLVCWGGGGRGGVVAWLVWLFHQTHVNQCKTKIFFPGEKMQGFSIHCPANKQRQLLFAGGISVNL